MKWYANLKISVKLIIGFLVVAVIAAIVGVVGVISIANIKQSDTELYQRNALGLQYSGSAAVCFQQIRYDADQYERYRHFQYGSS